MKRISAADLTRTALAKGAVLSHGGGVINASGQRLATQRPDAPKPPAPAPAPAQLLAPPPPPPDHAPAFVAAIERNGRQLAELTSTLVREIRAQQSASTQVEPITRWEFDIQRDGPQGLITGITAKATKGKVNP